MALTIGITGGIGSGKSSVSALLAAAGVPVVDADEVSRKVTAGHAPAVQEIGKKFGESVLNADGTLNRAALAAIVFRDPAALKSLEAITHPRIAAGITAQLAAANGPLVALDHPLLIESGAYKHSWQVWVVTAPENVRLERLTGARGMNAEDARARMTAQITDAQRLAHADVVVDNSGNQENLRDQVKRVLKRALEEAGQAP